MNSKFRALIPAFDFMYLHLCKPAHDCMYGRSLWLYSSPM